MDDIANVIATASLLLAVLAGLLGLWYPDVVKALEAEVPRLPAERRRMRKSVFGIFLYKAMPLAVASSAIATVFLPRAITVVSLSIALIGKEWRYSDLNAAFVLTQVLLLVVACSAVSLAFRLFLKANSLS
jgi:uncharacterized protein YjeT (DUF2065 family)